MKSAWENKCGTIRVISFTSEGHRRNDLLRETLEKAGLSCAGYRKGTAPGGSMLCEVTSMYDCVGEGWGKDTYLFIGAAGIAVRSIAPLVKDKFTDSPVLVMDEKGGYIIPLLSSHLGGAGEAARIISALTGAVPVVTTATDLNRKFAVDLFAKENGMQISDRTLAKEISARILQGGTVGFYSDFPVKGNVPEELLVKEEYEELREAVPGIAVLEKKPEEAMPNVLYLYPKIVSVGIGCRRGVKKEKIEQKIRSVLGRGGWKTDQIGVLASIDRKADEKGILDFASEYGIPFRTYTAGELNTVKQVTSSSDFVKNITGTDNVCERAALLAGQSGDLIYKKETFRDLTLAVVRMRCEVIFGETKQPMPRMADKERKGEKS